MMGQNVKQPPLDARLKEMLDRRDASVKRMRKWKRRTMVRGRHETKERCCECHRPLPYDHDRKSKGDQAMCNPCSARKQSFLNRQKKHLQEQTDKTLDSQIEGASNRARSQKWGDVGDQYEKHEHKKARQKLRKKGRR